MEDWLYFDYMLEPFPFYLCILGSSVLWRLTTKPTGSPLEVLVTKYQSLFFSLLVCKQRNCWWGRRSGFFWFRLSVGFDNITCCQKREYFNHHLFWLESTCYTSRIPHQVFWKSVYDSTLPLMQTGYLVRVAARVEPNGSSTLASYWLVVPICHPQTWGPACRSTLITSAKLGSKWGSGERGTEGRWGTMRCEEKPRWAEWFGRNALSN